MSISVVKAVALVHDVWRQLPQKKGVVVVNDVSICLTLVEHKEYFWVNYEELVLWFVLKNLISLAKEERKEKKKRISIHLEKVLLALETS